MENTELLQKLRAAAGPDPELDKELARVFDVRFNAGNYTASLDAALGLLPHVRDWRLVYSSGAPHPFSALILFLGEGRQSAWQSAWHNAPTAALAVCIAALEARDAS